MQTEKPSFMHKLFEPFPCKLICNTCFLKGVATPERALGYREALPRFATTTPQKALKKQKVGPDGRNEGDQPAEEAREMKTDHSPSIAPESPVSPLQPKEIFPEVQQDAQTQSCHKTPPWNKISPLHAEREKDIGSKHCQVQVSNLIWHLCSLNHSCP